MGGHGLELQEGEVAGGGHGGQVDYRSWYKVLFRDIVR